MAGEEGEMIDERAPVTVEEKDLTVSVAKVDLGRDYSHLTARLWREA